MTGVEIETAGIDELIAALGGVPKAVHQGWKRAAFRAGQLGKRIIQDRYRGEKETTDTATASRTGALRRSVAFRVEETADGIAHLIGWMKSSADAAILE